MTLVAISVVLLIAVLTVAVANLALVVGGRIQATIAADAAALAAAPLTFHRQGAAPTPFDEAALFAASNGATLISCRCPVDPSWSPRTVEVDVVTEIDLLFIGAISVRASSAAEFRPVDLGQ